MEKTRNLAGRIKQGGPDPAQQQQDQNQAQQSSEIMAAPVQPGMAQQAEQITYDYWTKRNAARTLDALRRGVSGPILRPFGQFGYGAGSEKRSKLAAPLTPEIWGLPNANREKLLKAALISVRDTQPRVSATGESGLVDQIGELP